MGLHGKAGQVPTHIILAWGTFDGDKVWRPLLQLMNLNVADVMDAQPCPLIVKNKPINFLNVMNEKKILKKSELLEQIRDDFRTMENGQNDIDPGFFTEEDVMSLYEFLLMRHSGEWDVVDDVEGENEGGQES